MSMEVSTDTTEKKYSQFTRCSVDGEIYYPDTDETVMPEGIQHFLLSVRLTSMILAFFAERSDVKVFGNNMLYYEEGNLGKVISPDLMVCFGLENMPERVYKLWEEKIVPSVVIEFSSDSTWFNDVSTKRAIYQKLGVKEYYIYDVEYIHLPQPLMAYRLDNGVLSEIKVRERRILSESLGLELVDTGETLRFFNPETNEFLMTPEEMATRLAELEKQSK